MGNWRLVSDLFVYVLSTKKVYFAPIDNKKIQSMVIKQIENPFIELKIENDGFNIKLQEDLNLYIKSDQFPEKEKYYKISNFDKNSLGKIITQTKNDMGDFLDIKFEAIFSDDFPGIVSFVNNSMSQYKACFEEMKRRMNCELCKKTKKWIPGHRYDTLTNTIYYLGEVKSRKQTLTNSELQEGTSMPTAYLYVEEIDDGCKKISEILKSKCFGKDIRVSFSQVSMVDCGKVLENDLEKFQDYWEDLIINTEKEESSIDTFGNPIYDNSKNIFSVISYQSGTEDLTISNGIKVIIEKVIRTIMKQTLKNYWNYNTSSIKLNNKQTVEENTNSLVTLTLTKIKDENILRCLYYKELFHKFNIPIEDIAKKIIINWNENDIFNDFNLYLKHVGYIMIHYPTSNIILQREKTKTYNIKDFIKVSDLYGENELSDSIIKLFEKSKSNYGVGISKFEYYNIGTKKDPKIYILANIKLDDLIKYFDGVDNMSENLKNIIMKKKFIEVDINVDYDKVLE